jgi:glycosyltransferase involved in cell wall biosynthesis/predicted O-methyltransferase YrrM
MAHLEANNVASRTNIGLPLNDYVSPDLDIIMPDAAFPHMIVGDTSLIRWPWLRRWVEHNWYTDRRNPEVGFASRDEAAILYNSALLFRGKPCLEVGCWRGWSTVHLALGSGSLDVIDPVFADPAFAESVRASCDAAGLTGRVTLHHGFSPGAIDELSQRTGTRWSLIFIDGDHEGDAPRLDAEAAMRNAADTAMVLFHDLASPHVAAGLDAMRNAGWRTMIYQTMQIMGVAWRGNVEPVAHTPDPNVFWTLPRHLAGYEVSFWKRPVLPGGRSWWPGMSTDDRRKAAMLRAQSAEDDRTEASVEREAALLRAQTAEDDRAGASVEREAALLRAQTAEDALAEASVERDAAILRAQSAEDRFAAARVEHEAVLERLRAVEDSEADLSAAYQRQSEYFNIVFGQAGWIVRKRILLGLLRRSMPRRIAAMQAYAAACGIDSMQALPVASALCSTRTLIGLLRRPRHVAQALVACMLLQAPRGSAMDPRGSERFDPTRENVIVVVHETSRTGAPILGWNIARALAAKYNLFTIHLGDGALTPEFQALSAATYGPFAQEGRNAAALAQALRPLFADRTFRYAIVNSVESRPLLKVFARNDVPTLFLIHEFGTYVYPAASLRTAFDCATEIVFPARIVARSSEVVHPSLRKRNYKILLPGMSQLPSGNAPPKPPQTEKLDLLKHLKAAGNLLVIGAGTVDFRKGVDLFLATAAAARREHAATSIHFVWVGHGYRPTEDMGYSVYLQEQLQRSELEGNVTFLGEVSDLEPIYALADVFLLTSRLDPLPNVSIDAAYRGIPIVCFQDASGTAELLLTEAGTAPGVVPYLDVAAAARMISHLAADPKARRDMAEATETLARASFNMDQYVNHLDELGSSLTPASARPRADATP